MSLAEKFSTITLTTGFIMGQLMGSSENGAEAVFRIMSGDAESETGDVFFGKRNDEYRIINTTKTTIVTVTFPSHNNLEAVACIVPPAHSWNVTSVFKNNAKHDSSDIIITGSSFSFDTADGKENDVCFIIALSAYGVLVNGSTREISSLMTVKAYPEKLVIIPSDCVISVIHSLVISGAEDTLQKIEGIKNIDKLSEIEIILPQPVKTNMPIDVTITAEVEISQSNLIRKSADVENIDNSFL